VIHVIRSRATPQQIDQMLQALGTYIKLAVDVKRRLLAGGGEFHADCEMALLDRGSRTKEFEARSKRLSRSFWGFHDRGWFDPAEVSKEFPRGAAGSAGRESRQDGFLWQPGRAWRRRQGPDSRVEVFHRVGRT
jgi:hypothetical protein